MPSFPITYPIVTTAVNYISRFLLTRDGIASEVRGQMKSAVFYFRPKLPDGVFPKDLDYQRIYPSGAIWPLGYIRVETIPVSQELALSTAMPRPGETVLNSVLLEE